MNEEQLKEEIRYLREQISKGTHLSEAEKKAIYYDLSIRTKEQTRNFLALYLALITVLISLITLVGYDTIKKAIIERIPIEQIKKNLLPFALDGINEAKVNALAELSEKTREAEQHLKMITKEAEQRLEIIKTTGQKAIFELDLIHRSRKRVQDIEIEMIRFVADFRAIRYWGDVGDSQGGPDDSDGDLQGGPGNVDGSQDGLIKVNK